MDQRFAYSPADLARVKCVQFGIISPDEIVSHSEPLLFICMLCFFLPLFCSCGQEQVFFVGFVEESFAHVVRVSGGETGEVDDWELLLCLFLFFWF